MTSLNGKIFLLQQDAELVEMHEAAYDSEALLQKLLHDHSALLAGDQIDPSEARRWILVKREAAVPDEDKGTGRWSLDHLFLDQDGIPTLVEVKRSSDTRIRREVVGQMLDYAANAVVYWRIDEIMHQYRATCEERGLDPDRILAEHIEEDVDPDEFWRDVKTNLEAGRIRLLFVADRIPTELQRIVEFLNEQMDPAEVLALEVKQFVGSSLQTLVPRIVGQTATAQQKKRVSSGVGEIWDRESILADLSARGFEQAIPPVSHILDWARNVGLKLHFGKGAKVGSVGILVREHGTNYQLGYFWSHGVINIPFNRLSVRPPFNEDPVRSQYREKLAEALGPDVAQADLDKSLDLPITHLEDVATADGVIQALEWAKTTICAFEPDGEEQK